MSDPDIKELLESPCEWTDYSCESIAGMALERIEELEGTVAEQNYAINMRDWRFEALEAENKRLRAALEDIADSEFSSGGQLRQIAREALAAVQETDDE